MSGSDSGPIIISYDEAVRRLVPDDEIHCFMNPSGGMLIGADWDRADVLKELREAKEIHETGEQAQGMKHGIAVKLKSTGDFAFFATVPLQPPETK